jgi:hypothetical protein
MDSITFKNFRKFKEETTFELNNINILVGPNNSGKSTLTKGIRLYLYNILNLKSSSDNIFSIHPFFNFGCDAFSNPHIGTFGRAISKGATENAICFSARFFNTIIDTTVSRYSKHSKDSDGNAIDYFNKAFAPITHISIYNLDYDTAYWFDFEEEAYSVQFNVSGNANYYEIWKGRIESLKKEQTPCYKESPENPTILNEIEDPNISRLKKCIDFGLKEKLVMGTKMSSTIIEGSLYERLISYVFKDATEKDFANYVVNPNPGNLFDNDNFVNYFVQINFDIMDDFDTYVKTEQHIVIEAHSVTHSLVYNISDKNDYMAQTILDYISQDIKDTDPEKKFIEGWMKKLGVGENFVIESFGGECFKFEIIEDTNHPDVKVPLLDKGVGSNQIMILLLRLATIMRQNRGTAIPCTIIIEEPEQNLHPKVQSLLADLFNEVSEYPQKTNEDSWGISFIVETHSEYLVRKTQVVVAQMFKKGYESGNIPFSVFYITGDDKIPSYEMGFQKNGKFEKSFGEGFYDVADDAAMELLDLDNEEN